MKIIHTRVTYDIFDNFLQALITINDGTYLVFPAMVNKSVFAY